MNGYLIDTNVISELRHSKRTPAVIRWFATVPDDELFVSVLTFGEIRQGIESLRPRKPEAAENLERWLATTEAVFNERILDFTRADADRWGRLIPPQDHHTVDSLLAATALTNDLTVATRNTSDFTRSGVRCVNPFEFP
jgi:toxin FitB